MSDWTMNEAVRRYGFILDRLGLPGAEVQGLHALEGETGEPDVFGYEAAESRVPGAVLHDRLLETLVESSRGFEAPRNYWNELPSMQLAAVLEPHDTEFLVAPNHDGESRISPASEGATTLGVRDVVAGTNAYTGFEYPDTALGSDNYPALVDAVQTALLADTNLRFVRLVDDGDCWRFLLVEAERLRSLVTEFGERIDLRGRPLLAAHQPAAFNRDVAGEREAVDGPPELVDDTGPSAVRRLFEAAASTSFETLSANAESVGAGVDVADASFDHGGASEPDVDALVDAEDPVSTAEEAVDGGAAAGGAVEGSGTTGPADSTVDDLDALFEDLDESTLDAAEGRDVDDASKRSSAEARGGESEGLADDAADIAALAATATVDWDVDDAYTGAFEDTLDAHELDDVFATLERDAAMSGFAGAATTDDDQVTSGDLLEVVDHENVGEVIGFGEFIWLDESELTPVPDAIADAAGVRIEKSIPRST